MSLTSSKKGRYFGGGLYGRDMLPASSGPNRLGPEEKERWCWAATGASGTLSLHSLIKEGFLEEEEVRKAEKGEKELEEMEGKRISEQGRTEASWQQGLKSLLLGEEKTERDEAFRKMSQNKTARRFPCGDWKKAGG